MHGADPDRLAAFAVGQAGRPSLQRYTLDRKAPRTEPVEETRYQRSQGGIGNDDLPPRFVGGVDISDWGSRGP